jgi:hypothetical protein
MQKIIDEKTNINLGIKVYGKGKPYLKSKTPNLNKSALGSPIIMLVDQDSAEQCPDATIKLWLLGQPQSPNFVIRFAKITVESWILADRKNIAKFLGVSETNIPMNTDHLDNPKQLIVHLAGTSKHRVIRDTIALSTKSRATVGPNYNSQLSKFIASEWDVSLASTHSKSLAKAIFRLKELDIRISE